MKTVAQLDARLTGDQEVAGLTPAGTATFFRGDVTMKYNVVSVVFSFQSP